MKTKRSVLLSGVTLLLSALSCASEPEPVGVVTAASPEAVEAGVRVLEAGGNAIDAAVAVQFALGVTEPAMSGLGGQTQILVRKPGEPPFVINGTSYSPAATPRDASRADINGHTKTTIPATVKTLDFAFRNFGSGRVEWAALLEPAITYADSGFVIGDFRHKVWLRHLDELAANELTARMFLAEDGTIPELNSTFRQPVLAATLRRLAQVGADDFYLGTIAQEIAADMQASGGWITEEDLASVPEPRVHPPLEISYRSHTVATLTPPGGGWVMLQILNLIELNDPVRMRSDESYRVEAVARALRIGHSTRRSDPVTDLTNFEVEASARISKETARTLWDQPFVGESAGEPVSETGGETTHFSVVDGNGMAVSVTASINAYFGARVVSPSLGFLYNSYMDEFEIGQPDHPFALKPRSMPYSSMSPTIVSLNDQPVLVLGSPGSARIISSVAQVTHRWVDLQETIGNAVAAARLHVVPPQSLYLESGATQPPAQWITSNGYTLTQPATDLMQEGRNAYYGGVHAIAFEDGRWLGSADPRRDGTVGYALR